MNNYSSISVAKSRVFGATLLITGTCVGGGMLALPVETASVGLFPSLLMMFVAWAFMTFSGLLYVEASLWMPEGGHVMTMAARLLGPWGKGLTTLLYLFMGYASLIAYTSGGAGMMHNFVEGLGGLSLSKAQSLVLFTALFGSWIYLGTQFISRINALLVIGLVVAYGMLVVTGLKEVDATRFERLQWTKSAFSLPLLLAAFSYQMIVPSLTSYLNRSPYALRKAVIWGTTVPFVVYALWQVIILGSVPYEGDLGLAEAFKRGEAATNSFVAIVRSQWLARWGEYFGFFALLTSYLGIGLGLFDFLADMFKLRDQKRGPKAVLIGLAIVLPVLLFALFCPRAFLICLEVSGGFGDSMLNGFIPVSMVWLGRYIHRLEGPYQVLGGKKSLGLALCLALFVLILQCVKLCMG